MRTVPAAPVLMILLASAFPLPGRAAKTSEGQTTYWDMMMQAQAARDLAEGSAYMESRRYPDAAREFAKAVIKNPSDALSHRMLGAARWLGEVDQAEAEFNEASSSTPRAPRRTSSWASSTRGEATRKGLTPPSRRRTCSTPAGPTYR